MVANRDANGEGKTGNSISRRKVIATSAAAFLGASTSMRGASPNDKADVGDKMPHLNFSLQGKSALVTGGARGIGPAISVGLAATGADVLGLDICAAAAPNLVYPPATPEELDETGKMVEGQKRKWIATSAPSRA